MSPETLIFISICIAIAVGTIWLLTFGMVWALLGVGLFISGVVLLFSGAIGPALGCLILCPIAFFLGGAILEKKDEMEERRLCMASIPVPAPRPPLPIGGFREPDAHIVERNNAPEPQPSFFVALAIVCSTMITVFGALYVLYMIFH